MDQITDPAPGAAAPHWARRASWLVGAGALVLIGAGVGIGLAVGSRGSGDAPAAAAATASSTPLPLTLNGSVSVPFLGSDLYAPQAIDPSQSATTGPTVDDPCVTTGGFTDISQGVAVTIGGPDGKTVAVGALQGGQVTGSAGQPASCTFQFDVQVPPNLSEYTVTISHRGTQVFTPQQVLDGNVDLTVGSS